MSGQEVDSESQDTDILGRFTGLQERAHANDPCYRRAARLSALCLFRMVDRGPTRGGT